jgi:hypothetical protein
MVFQGNIRNILVTLASCQDAHATPSATTVYSISSLDLRTQWVQYTSTVFIQEPLKELLKQIETMPENGNTSVAEPVDFCVAPAPACQKFRLRLQF